MILLETVTAAPVLDSSNTDPTIRKTRSTRPSHLRKKAGNFRNREHSRWGKILNMTDWSNPCHSAGNFEVTSEVSTTASTNFTEPSEIKTAIFYLNQTLNNFTTQNTTQWEKFHNDSFGFLPTEPKVSFSYSLDFIFTRASCETLEKGFLSRKITVINGDWLIYVELVGSKFINLSRIMNNFVPRRISIMFSSMQIAIYLSMRCVLRQILTLGAVRGECRKKVLLKTWKLFTFLDFQGFLKKSPKFSTLLTHNALITARTRLRVMQISTVYPFFAIFW